MKKHQLITITTDFSYQDPFVGIMKGIILSEFPDTNIIDLNHGIRPQDIMQTALSLSASVFFFPKQTIHLIVVDPGVGSSCKRLAARTKDYHFVYPDNGVIDLVFAKSPPQEIVEINTDLFKKKSQTFHGRDIFAPVAAKIASGKRLSSFGVPIDWEKKLTLPDVQIVNNQINNLSIIYQDHFGNMFFNLNEQDFPENNKYPHTLIINNINFPVCSSYADAGQGNPGIILNSFGYYELFICNGNASENYDFNIPFSAEFF